MRHVWNKKRKTVINSFKKEKKEKKERRVNGSFVLPG